MPRMLREIVRTHLERTPGFAIEAEEPTPDRLLDAVRATNAHVVVFGTDSADLPDVGRAVLAERPRVKLLAVTHDGRRTWLFELRPHRQALGEVSPDELADAIRAAVYQPAGAW